MPKLDPIPGTDILPEDNLPAAISQAESNLLALRAFFYDYCITSNNSNLSRGFLSGLEIMACRLGSKSDLAKACQAVAFASHSKPLRRPRLLNLAETLYQELLGSLAKAIKSPILAYATESKLVAMLLGLYQMIMSTENDYGNHDAHAKGLSALMKVGHSPLNLLCTVLPNHILIPNKTSQAKKIHGMFSVPALTDHGENLDDLLLSLNLAWATFEASSGSKDFCALRTEYSALDRRFAMWQYTRVTEFKPIKIGQVSERPSKSGFVAGYWPGNVDTYFDLYVAGVWNIFRAARIILIAQIIKLSDALEDNDSCVDYICTANRVVEEMIASVPYHLADNLQVFISELKTCTEISSPGRLLGGLLLMHPLYVACQMPFLSQDMREYMWECLVWIGSNMGFGQATLLAKVRRLGLWLLKPFT